MKTPEQSIVHVIDDDEAVRDSISMLLDTDGHRTPFVRIGARIPERVQRSAVRLSRARHPHAGHDRPGTAGGAESTRRRAADHLHHRPRRHSDGGRSDAPRRARFHAQTVRRRRPARSASTRRLRTMRPDATNATRSTVCVFASSRCRRANTKCSNRVGDGQANKFVAIELGISERTVEIHRAQVMKKMGARTLAQLVRMKIDLERATSQTT